MPRLIDLHCDWPLQYAAESTDFDPALYPGVAGRVGQAAGYLQDCSASVVACYRRAEDWSTRPDPWAALGALVARVEAEFPGRILAEPADLGRWDDDPGGPCWAVLGVEGFDALVRAPADLDRLPNLFDRGVRVFQPTYGPEGVLAGSSAPGDGRGLADLGRDFLRILADLARPDGGPRAALDLAHLNPSAMSDVLDWFEADAGRPSRLVPLYSHGALRHDGFDSPRAIAPANLRRLRALGGVAGFGVGPPFYHSTDSLKAGIEAAAATPHPGNPGGGPGYAGLGVGTDFLGVDRTLPGLGAAGAVLRWFAAAFGPDAPALLAGNARVLIDRLAGRGQGRPTADDAEGIKG